jgi:hypothetical protein
MKERWWKFKITDPEKPWEQKLLVLFMAFAIAGAITVVYRIVFREVVYKKEIPIESMKPDWQAVGPSTAMMFEGESYTGDVYFDRLSLEKKENKITLWLKVVTHRPVVGKGTDNFTWDEQIARWVVDCGTKEVKVDYMTFSFQGKKQYGGKIDDLNFPIVKGTTSYSIYEMFCF